MTNLFKFSKKHNETEDELIIRWADTLISQSNYKGDIDTSSFLPFDELFHPTVPTDEDRIVWSMDKARQIRNEIVSKYPLVDGNLDPLSKHISKFRETVLRHLLNEGYIKEPIVTATTWQLTEKGKLVKELNGHLKYKEHRQRELNILRNQNKVNNLLILATFLAAIMPFVAQFTFPNKETPNPIYVIADTLHSTPYNDASNPAQLKSQSNQDTTEKVLNRQTKQKTP